MNIKLIFSLSFCFFIILPAFISAQSARAFEKAGDEAMLEKDYYTAIYFFEQAVERKDDDVNLYFKYGEAARQFYAFDLAKTAYKKVLQLDKANQYPLTQYWLAKVLQQSGSYEEALQSYQTYITNSKAAVSFLADAKKQQEACLWAQELLAEEPNYKVQLLDKKINSPYSEFGAIQYGDTLFFSSYRFKDQSDEEEPIRNISKVLIAKGSGRGRVLSRDFNSNDKLTAHTTFSVDRQTVYFTICEYGKGVSFKCAIYSRKKDQRNRWDRKMTKLPETINLQGFTATHPSVGYDSTLKQEVLYFTSDRPGGAGGLDIWKSAWDKEKKQFGEPSPVKPINTENDELTPFFHTATQSLFFSSDGYVGFGGYDVYQYQVKDPDPEIIHLGPAVNSSYNDLYFAPKDDGKTGYFASNRPGGFFLDRRFEACCNDIYSYEWVEPAPSTAVDSLPPVVVTTIPKPEPEVVPIEPEKPAIPITLEDFLPLALYFDNDEPDKRTLRTSTQKNYLGTYDDYYERKERYLKEYAQPLPEEDQAVAEAELDIFFEEEVRKGKDFLIRFSDILLQKLEAGEEVEIFIKGFTSPRAKSDYNFRLGQRRVSCVKNHFSTYSKAVFQPFLDSGQLIISERSFGETTAAATIADDLEDQRNSIYHPDAARERRVEIVEIKRNKGN